MTNFKELFLSTTDTVTGIGAPINGENKKAIFELKRRQNGKRLVIMVGSLNQAKKLKGWTNKATTLAKKVWPGAFTIVVDKKLAVRMPNKPGLLKLIQKIGPIYMTSANYSGERIFDFEEAKAVFREIHNYYYFGKGSGEESVIIDLKTGEELR